MSEVGEFWDILLANLCNRTKQLILIFALSLVMLFFSLVAFFIAERGTATRAVVVLDLISLTVFSVLSGGIVWWCRGDS